MDLSRDDLLDELCTRRLDHALFPRIYVDATYVKSRQGDGVAYEAIVAATGARADGALEVLGIDVGDSEEYAFWLRFLFTLRSRGLEGVEVLGSDEHGGLREALAEIFPGARWELSPGGADPLSPDRDVSLAG